MTIWNSIRNGAAKMSIEKKLFGVLPDGKEVYSYTLERGDISARIIEFGARISKVLVGGVSVVCGFDCMGGYLKDNDYHGSIVGRYANRISKGKFTLNGKEYTLALNEKDRCHLHGGKSGFSDKVWEYVCSSENEDADAVTLRYISSDGEEGYPGTLTLDVTYKLTDAGELIIDYKAVSDKDTVINLTNHSYFSLSGVGNTILDHELTLNCDKMCPVDEILIPFGYLKDVEGTPFDFREKKTIGRDIRADDEQLKTGGGYDHCFVRGNAENTDVPELIGSIHSPVSGITMDIYTTEGGIQMYTGNFMTADNPFFGNIPQVANQAVALECNRIPDSPNQKAFPSPVFKAGEEYLQTTIYKFSK